MVAKKKKTNKKSRAALGDTPITVGGGGDGVIPTDVTIDFNKDLWTVTPGRLTLARGRIKSVSLSFDGVNVVLPVKGTLTLKLECNKP